MQTIKAIGEFLKRLRLRAEYKQAELGAILNVTDKAISRWESGTGTPDLNNLMALAKLYGITVDDILNCNERVFENLPQGASDNINEGDATPPSSGVENDESTRNTENDDSPMGNKVFLDPSRKFGSILYFAYVVFGIYLTNLRGDAYERFTAFYIIYPILILADAVIGTLKFKLPKRIYAISIILVEAATVLAALVHTITEAAFEIGSTTGTILALGCAAFMLLFGVRLIYTLSELIQKPKTTKILRLSALAVCAAAVILSVVSISIFGIKQDYESDSELFSLINIAFGVATLAAFTFALGQITSKSVNVITVILMFCGAAIAPLSFVAAAQNPFSATGISDGGFTTEILLATAAVAPTCLIIGRLLEGSTNELAAARITAVLSVAVLIPLLCYLIDAFAVNVFLRRTLLAAADCLSISAIVASFLSCIVAFKPMELIKMLSGGREKK